MPAEIVAVPLLADNYAYLVHRGKTTVVIDPSEAPGVERVLEERGWKLDAILNTHHHWDHVGGDVELKRAYGCKVFGPKGDEGRIRGMDLPLFENFSVGELEFDVLHIPGHTHHHAALWMKSERAVFTGDTLFLMGCGKMFEGTPSQMWGSLSRLAELPDETRVYCGHEYTESNARFARTLLPEDSDFKRRYQEVVALRAQSLPSVPGAIGEEKRSNPFLRLADAEYRRRVTPDATDAVSAFAELRKRKDGA